MKNFGNKIATIPYGVNEISCMKLDIWNEETAEYVLSDVLIGVSLYNVIKYYNSQNKCNGHIYYSVDEGANWVDIFEDEHLCSAEYRDITKTIVDVDFYNESEALFLVRFGDDYYGTKALYLLRHDSTTEIKVYDIPSSGISGEPFVGEAVIIKRHPGFDIKSLSSPETGDFGPFAVLDNSNSSVDMNCKAIGITKYTSDGSLSWEFKNVGYENLTDELSISEQSIFEGFDENGYPTLRTDYVYELLVNSFASYSYVSFTWDKSMNNYEQLKNGYEYFGLKWVNNYSFALLRPVGPDEENEIRGSCLNAYPFFFDWYAKIVQLPDEVKYSKNLIMKWINESTAVLMDVNYVVYYDAKNDIVRGYSIDGYEESDVIEQPILSVATSEKADYFTDGTSIYKMDNNSSENLSLRFKKADGAQEGFSIGYQSGSPYKFWPGIIEYSLDGETWTEFTGERIEVADQILFRGVNGGQGLLYSFTNEGFIGHIESPFYVSSSVPVEVDGDLMALYDYKYDHGKIELPEYYFASLFSHGNIIFNTELPDIILSYGCFDSMFAYSKIRYAPSLVKYSTLAPHCFNSMFMSCKNIVEMPEMPQWDTQLERGCFQSMFQGTSIGGTPLLNYTKLAHFCYLNMFAGTMVQSSENIFIPEEVGESACFLGMFANCTKLTKAFDLTNISVNAEAVFVETFLGCTSLKEASVPKALNGTYDNNCCESMFQDCKNLVTVAGEISANYYGTNAFNGAFSGCTSLKNPPKFVKPKTGKVKIGSKAFQNMFSNCIFLTEIPENIWADEIDTEYSSSHYAGMFSGCTGLDMAKYKVMKYQKEYEIPAIVDEETANELNVFTDMFAGVQDMDASPASGRTYYLYDETANGTESSGLYVADIQLGSENFWTRFRRLYQSGQYTDAIAYLNNANLPKEKFIAEKLNLLTTYLVKVQRLNDPDYEIDKIQVYTQSPTNITSGDVYFEWTNAPSYTFGDIDTFGYTWEQVNSKNMTFETASRIGWGN